MRAFFDSFAGRQLTLRCKKEYVCFSCNGSVGDLILSVCDSVLQLAFRHVPYRCHEQNTRLSKKMDGIWNRYNLKSTGRIYTFGVLKRSEKFKVLDLP